MREAADRHPAGAGVVVGNAPTALVEVIRLAETGRLDPALVIGLPVGFVGAAEAKARLARSGAPAISNVGERRRRGRRRRAQRAVAARPDRRRGGHPVTRVPIVHLVGAGPGDVRLLTRRAADLLARADVVVLDRPSLDPIAYRSPRGRSGSTWVGGPVSGRGPPTATVALLAERARAGLLVVRLKGGDPFVCSRGGEEALALRAEGIDVQVTPGVTAATAAPARRRRAAGPRSPWPPATTTRCRRRSAGRRSGRSTARWSSSSAGPTRAPIADGLIAGGRPAVAPAALVHAATRVGERVVSGSARRGRRRAARSAGDARRGPGPVHARG